MTTLVLHLDGPMQAWGHASQWDHRDTLDYPTRSGVIGMIAAALGKQWGDSLDDLSPLRFTIRIDRPGRRIVDYHTAGGGYEVGIARVKGGNRAHAVLSDRFYMSDAAYTVAITGPDTLLYRVDDALRAPVFGPFLGRRSCPPAGPWHLGLHDGDPLRTLPLHRDKPRDGDTVAVEFVSDHETHGPTDRVDTTLTDPHEFGPRRSYGTVTTHRWTETLPVAMCGGTGIQWFDALTTV
ncbi:type I-E CRISPR-associated protein Cas5/CasD [Saccharomonospora viridis]|uniref:CRISPR-associated protein Cas5 n=1 Tax=Saccharomonospora viridis (strain ATCC 15386 / DSM 43017 / JCM 3036 / CCUG 5913 / NBRC 12207 / NCIMB 9602 / P101) TaxID=471857 RepID=C7MQD6_SACVD|nr:type I-E CRISPR-associated protein Cas5/CasD [Saccharomonospora viridis]ACU96435.1 CRISPR-associated protein Cas5 [Saccharomonospora viridis DSM 43017]